MKLKIHIARCIVLFVVWILSSFYSFSQYNTQGPLSGSSFSDDNSIGNFPFSIPGNAVTSDNNRSSANALLILLNGNTHYLKVTGFGFSIPALATITGIRVDVEKSAWDISILATVKDNSIRLVKGGSPIGDNKADGTSWTDTDDYDSYGDTTDTWGTTWTPAEVNASDFGVVFSAKINGLLSLIPTARVDHIRVTVFYIISLPIHFLDFKVELKDENQASLKWTTADNDEKVNFIVQRSFNAYDWDAIQTLNGEISYSIKKYEYVDHIPSPHLRFFYRIKMVLLSGAELYTKIVYADFKNEKSLTLFPNPAKGSVYISCNGNESVSLYSINGEKMKVNLERINSNYLKINTILLKPGLYVVQSGDKKRQLLLQ